MLRITNIWATDRVLRKERARFRPRLDWVRAELPDGSQFHFMPRFQWNVQERYVVDKPGVLFSIGLAGRG